MTEKHSIEDILSLIEQNFEFLHIGIFLSHYIKEHNLSPSAKNILLPLGGNRSYLLSGVVIKDSLSSCFIEWNKSNILGYFVTWNAFRCNAMAMHEGILKNMPFKDYLKKILGDKFEHFWTIISFIRNVLSHNIHNEIKLIIDNYKDTQKYFIKNVNKEGIVSFEFVYYRDFPEKILFPESYGFEIKINLKELQEGIRFIDIISEWNLYMIMELCSNLVYYYRKQGLRDGRDGLTSYPK